MDRLVSITSFVSSSGSVNQAPRLFTTFSAQASATSESTVPATTDVRRLPCLYVGADVEIAEILAQYGLVAGVKTKIR